MRLLIVLVVAGVAGCSAKLETGYEPRKLGSSEAVRRSYYAEPFTPEAKGIDERRTPVDVPRPRGAF